LYRRILVPLDGSIRSEAVLDQARAMVLDYCVPEMVLLTVVEPFREQPYRKDDDWNVRLQKEAVRVSENYALKERLAAEGVNVKAVVLEGDPAHQILDFAVIYGADLIMMSAKGSTTNNRWIFGGVANRVIRHSSVPVLICS
jgi:nucleotide-binding universal stress UspA family protein